MAEHEPDMILIVTISNDLHALAVQKAVRSAGTEECYIIECDRIAQRNFMSFGINYAVLDRVLTSEGFHVSLSDATILWLRTLTSEQLLAVDVKDDSARSMIHNDCRGGLLGFLSVCFRGK